MVKEVVLLLGSNGFINAVFNTSAHFFDRYHCYSLTCTDIWNRLMFVGEHTCDGVW